MNENVKEYFEAINAMLTDVEKLQLVNALNETLPPVQRFAKTSVVSSSDDFLDALAQMSRQFSRIMFSSAYNPWVFYTENMDEELKQAANEVNEVSSFEEFVELSEKINELYVRYKESIDKFENLCRQHQNRIV